MISTGLCGALDPALRLGDIVVSGNVRIEVAGAPFVRGRFTPSIMWPSPPPKSATLRKPDRRDLPSKWKPRRSKGKRAEWEVPFYVFARCRTRRETLAAGFQSLSRRATDDFSRTRIALAAIARPFTVMPQLMELRPELPQGRRCPGRFSCRLPILDLVTAEVARLATMHAAVYKGASVVEVESMPVPEIGPGEVLIRVESCGICPTDLKKIAYNLLPAPRIYGHETAGVIAAVGAGVTRYQPGDRVIVFHHIPCGKCFYCRQKVVRAVPGV